MVQRPAALNEVEADVIDPPRYHEQGEHGVFVDNKLSGQLVDDGVKALRTKLESNTMLRGPRT
jgi:hypothetical protein